MSENSIAAVLFDLDDTFYPQSEFLSGAWRAVAVAASDQMNLDFAQTHRALEDVAAEGSDRGRIIDRALARVGAADADVTALVEVFRGYAPDRLQPYPGARSALVELRRTVPVGLVTDGDSTLQRSKLQALQLADDFDVVVFSDDLGRQHRKPDPLPFLTALTALGVPPDNAVYVGDRPDKDVLGAVAAGLRAIRVRTGEYAEVPTSTPAWREVSDVVQAILLCRAYLADPVARRM